MEGLASYKPHFTIYPREDHYIFFLKAAVTYWTLNQLSHKLHNSILYCFIHLVEYG